MGLHCSPFAASRLCTFWTRLPVRASNGRRALGRSRLIGGAREGRSSPRSSPAPPPLVGEQRTAHGSTHLEPTACAGQRLAPPGAAWFAPSAALLRLVGPPLLPRLLAAVLRVPSSHAFPRFCRVLGYTGRTLAATKVCGNKRP